MSNTTKADGVALSLCPNQLSGLLLTKNSINEQFSAKYAGYAT